MFLLCPECNATIGIPDAFSTHDSAPDAMRVDVELLYHCRDVRQRLAAARERAAVLREQAATIAATRRTDPYRHHRAAAVRAL